VNRLARSESAAELGQVLAVCPVPAAPYLGGLGAGGERAAVACVVGSAPWLIPVVVAFAVPLLPRPGVGADLVVTVAARARRRLGLPGHRRGSDEPGQEHGSCGDRQRRRQLQAEPHVVPSPRGRTTDAATPGGSWIRTAVSSGPTLGELPPQHKLRRFPADPTEPVGAKAATAAGGSQAPLPLPQAAASNSASGRRAGSDGIVRGRMGNAMLQSPAIGAGLLLSSRGRLIRPQGYEAAHHAWWRRADIGPGKTHLRTPEAGGCVMTTTEDKTIEQRAQEYYELVFDDETRALLDKAEGGNEDAYERLSEIPYAISKYVTYHYQGTTEWHVELAGGGPAARLVVIVGQDGEICEARFEFQDWFTFWTSAPSQDENLVKRFAYMVGYYHD
jgi:hypothetical protein